MINTPLIINLIDQHLEQVGQHYIDSKTALKLITQEKNINNHMKLLELLLELPHAYQVNESIWHIPHSQESLQDQLLQLIPIVDTINKLTRVNKTQSEKWLDDLSWVGSPMSTYNHYNNSKLIFYLRKLPNNNLDLIFIVYYLGKYFKGNVRPKNLRQTIEQTKKENLKNLSIKSIAQDSKLFFYLSQGLDKLPLDYQYIITKIADESHTEISDIKKLIDQYYFNAFFRNRRPENMLNGFHPNFTIYALFQNKLKLIPLYEFMAAIDQANLTTILDQKWQYTVPLIDISGDAAVAKVDLWRNNNHIYTVYLSLYHFNSSGWLIISKTYYQKSRDQLF